MMSTNSWLLMSVSLIVKSSQIRICYAEDDTESEVFFRPTCSYMLFPLKFPLQSDHRSLLLVQPMDHVHKGPPESTGSLFMVKKVNTKRQHNNN